MFAQQLMTLVLKFLCKLMDWACLAKILIQAVPLCYTTCCVWINYFYHIVQGDQKVSVHLMITLQKVTRNVQSVPPPVSRHLLTRRNVFSKTVFSIARSTFRMYSVMAIFRSWVVWGLFEYTECRWTETFWSPYISCVIYMAKLQTVASE